MNERVVRKAAAPGCTPGRLPARSVPKDDPRRCCVCLTPYRSPSFAWRCERWHWADNERR